MMGNCKKLDERQLLQRGNVFQHCMLLLFILLMLDAFFKEEGFIWAEGMWENILILWIALTLCFCEFIVLEITPMGKAMGVFYVFLGIGGAFIAILCASRIAMGKALFIDGYTLTQEGSEILEGCLMVFIFLIFLGKKVYNRWKEKQEDEA